MATFNLKKRSRAGGHQYGLVQVFNLDGSFDREYKITPQQLDQLHESGNGVPPGLTWKEWHGGMKRCVVLGKALNVGDMEVRDDGSVLVKVDEAVVRGRIRETMALFSVGEFIGVPPNITVTRTVIDKMELAVRDPQNRTKVDAMENGVLTTRGR